MRIRYYPPRLAAEWFRRLIRWLCLPGAAFVTGQTIHVSGGQFLP